MDLLQSYVDKKPGDKKLQQECFQRVDQLREFHRLYASYDQVLHKELKFTQNKSSLTLK
jgi:hypothetical protein